MLVPLILVLTLPCAYSALAFARARRMRSSLEFPGGELEVVDPGVAHRAEQQARRMLRASASEEDWELYNELGLIRVWGSGRNGPAQGGTRATRQGASYAFLIYPSGPVVSYLPKTLELLGELTPAEEVTRHARTPTDVVLATWLALCDREDEVVGEAGFHLPGHRTDVEAVRRDLWRLTQWEQARLRRRARERTPDAQ